MLRIAIIGCGKVADAHASQIRRIHRCEIVGACDREELMVQQFAERFGVKRGFGDVSTMISAVRPDVVHITTPPQSHFEIARLCVEHGCHVYVEKPFTLNTAEAEELLSFAEFRGLKVTAGHDQQFSHAARRMRDLIRRGYLGGRPVHMESTWCYDLGGQMYARAVLGDKEHWVRKLPGRLLHNLISHGVAKIAEFLAADTANVIAVGRTSAFLRDLGESDIVDELRVVITEEAGPTAYFTFSSQMRPALHQFCIYGSRNGLVIDEDHQTLIRVQGKRFKSYVEKFVPPMISAKEYVGNLLHNARLFLERDFHMDSGKKYLVEAFYASIVKQTPVPIPYRQILLTSRIMDSIFKQVAFDQSVRPKQLSVEKKETDVRAGAVLERRL
jgi:predicted dehydrogenase